MKLHRAKYELTKRIRENFSLESKLKTLIESIILFDSQWNFYFDLVTFNLNNRKKLNFVGKYRMILRYKL